MSLEYTEPLGNITSANATMVLTVEDLYPIGIPITNFSTDQMADSDEHEYAQAMVTNRRTYEIGLTITVPSLKQVHFFKQGVLLNGKDLPGLRKTLEPTQWKFTFAKYNQLGI